MPELPEVETTRRGIERHVAGRTITRVVVRDARLRWKVPTRLVRDLAGETVHAVQRRAKYLLLRTGRGTIILHLGMSGSVRILPAATPPGPHDHVDLVLDNDACVRLTDPRRFGTLLWTREDLYRHPLLRHLGPEPLGEAFDGDYLYARARGRRVAVKQFLMDSRIVAGLGNIYANEALFLAGIHPLRAAGRISRERYARLAQAIRQVLNEAIAQGGTTLRDFTASDGRPGYFQLHLRVYGRDGEPCPRCGRALRGVRQGQRSSFLCGHCQR